MSDPTNLVCQSAAIRVLDWLVHAERDLINAEVITTSGDSGVVRGVRLDDLHGVCFTFDEPPVSFDIVELGALRNWKPVSIIRSKA
jgi:hypothetical protein